MQTAALPVLFERALTSGRLHSAYLISGPREAAREAAHAFARASVCERGVVCGECAGCRRSTQNRSEWSPMCPNSGPLWPVPSIAIS